MCICGSFVTIPHGGLRTSGMREFVGLKKMKESPSHTVGLELYKGSSSLSVAKLSPSHAVGSEL